MIQKSVNLYRQKYINLNEKNKGSVCFLIELYSFYY